MALILACLLSLSLTVSFMIGNLLLEFLMKDNDSLLLKCK